MSEGELKPAPAVSSLPSLQLMLQRLGYSADDEAEDAGVKMLARLSADTRDFLLQRQTTSQKWLTPPSTRTTTSVHGKEGERAELKNVLGWALAHNDFRKAVAVLTLLDGSQNAPVDSSLFDEVMHYVEAQADDVIPPQLLLSWSRRLQVKGDLHGAIRRLTTAKTMLTEHKESFPCPCEAERIRGECLQLSGLTLNKMCCWKSAVHPLVESADIFRSLLRERKGIGRGRSGDVEATLVCVHLAAYCLCTITDGDYLDLRHQLPNFQHRDRFYQAYTMCKEAAGLATSSQLMFIKVQNQAAESVLKYAAQQEDLGTRNRYLQTVILEAKHSLQAHTSLADLEQRVQFFELIHSVFLIFLALDFSDDPRDRLFAARLEEQARNLYGEYCRQLTEEDFLGDRIDLEICPQMKGWLSGLAEDFGLKLDLESLTAGNAAEERPAPRLGGREESLTGKSFLLHDDHDQTNAMAQNPQESHYKQAEDEEEGRAKETAAAGHRQEVGLPINPQHYAIPVYDVPLTIFQDLCGCKLSGDSAHEGDLRLMEQATRPQGHASNETDEAERASPDSGPLLGITHDSGYGSSVALVDTILTTQLLEAEDGRSSGVDSGVGSSSFSCSSGQSAAPPLSDAAGDAKLQSSVAGSELVKKARLLKFNPVTGLWSSQTSLLYVGQPLRLDDKVKGHCRDALHVQFLHQDEVMGRYVGKRYRRQRPPSQYMQDVTCQKTARFLVTLFNYALQDLRYDIQVVYVPVAHVQVLSRDGGHVVDWLNVEPYLEGDFIKLTNNLKFCNSQGKTLATALTHFTHSVSEGRLMLVDLQGWLPKEGRGVVYLTDPQFHTSSPSTTTPLSSCDMGSRGMRAFWDTVHPHCNAICRRLGLKRPDQDSPPLQGVERRV